MKERISKWLFANTVGTKGAGAPSRKTTQQVAAGVGADPAVAYEILLAMKADGTAQMAGSGDITGARWATNTLVPAAV